SLENCIIKKTPEQVAEMEKAKNLPILEELALCNTVQIIQPTFYDFDGKTYLSGGAERYLCDLAEIITNLGYRPFIVQGGNSFWYRKHNNIDVFGVPSR